MCQAYSIEAIYRCTFPQSFARIIQTRPTVCISNCNIVDTDHSCDCTSEQPWAVLGQPKEIGSMPTATFALVVSK